MSKNAAVLAMDLGTCNTCLALYEKSEDRERIIRPQDLCSETFGGSIPSLVLYEDGSPVAAGALAEAEYGECGEKTREHYRLSSLFKPDVTTRPEARTAMTDFLRLLGNSTERPEALLVGMPSEAGNLYRERVRECLREAGWGDAVFLSEPLGAVLHYLVKGALSPAAAARGVLTVDFGGGTCDFATLKRADVVDRSGDLLYGGRLFDDLFWQLLLERNPGLEERLEAEGNAYYVHWLACRQAKEEFSRAMHRDISRPVTLRVRRSVWDGRQAVERAEYISDLGWHDFLLCAGQYKASASLLDLLRGHDELSALSARASDLLAGRTVDLIQWFDDLLRACLRTSKGENISAVLLTGGSSAWPFVEDAVRAEMGPNVPILSGDEPYADIARGLARYYALSEKLQSGRDVLHDSMRAFMHRTAESLEKTLDNAAAETADRCIEFLKDTIIVPRCTQFRSGGGSLRALREGFASALDAHAHYLSEILEGTADEIGDEMTRIARESMRQWFVEAGVPLRPEGARRIVPCGKEEILLGIRKALNNSSLAPLRDKLAWGIMTAIAVTGAAGAGIAGIFSSGGAVLPILLTAGLGGAAVKYTPLGNRLIDRVQDFRIPRFLLKGLTDRHIAELADSVIAEFRAEVHATLTDVWGDAKKRMLEQTEKAAEEEIEALDVLRVAPV